MKARIEVEIDAPAGKRAMLQLAEVLTRLAAEVMRAGVVFPVTWRSAAGKIVAKI